jgi:hypothetical protein
MSERVEALDLDTWWDPNAPAASLTISDRGRAWLRLRPHPDDPDGRLVVLSWEGCSSASLTPPNDEALAGHRLYGKGLEDVLWIGEVMESEYIARLEVMNRVHDRHDPDRYAGLRHFVLPLKECTVEVVSESPPRVERGDT